MKNIYELSRQEKKNYRSEFNKLKFTKDINAVRMLSLFIAILSLFASVMLLELVDVGMKLQTWVDFANTIGIISLVLFAILEVYLNIAFMRWMKIKHNVEY